MQIPLLQVNNLKTYFHTSEGAVKAVDGVSFSLSRGETLGLVGESGCGKSVTALSVMRLIPNPPGKIEEGEVFLEGRDILRLPMEEVRGIRGREIGMIFQEPMTSLNPVQTVGSQVREVLLLHGLAGKDDAREAVLGMFVKVGMRDPAVIFRSYPHELSGGMRQRVMIAMALICKARLLIADEPTTALDVTIQAQILDLIRGLQSEMGMAVLMITHNLGIVAEMADQVAVMYAGKIVEYAGCREIFACPLHPYTKGLLASIPLLDGKKGSLYTIPGAIPDPLDFPKGCCFHPRCEHATEICREKAPSLREAGAGHDLACWRYFSEK